VHSSSAKSKLLSKAESPLDSDQRNPLHIEKSLAQRDASSSSGERMPHDSQYSSACDTSSGRNCIPFVIQLNPREALPFAEQGVIERVQQPIPVIRNFTSISRRLVVRASGLQPLFDRLSLPVLFQWDEDYVWLAIPPGFSEVPPSTPQYLKVTGRSFHHGDSHPRPPRRQAHSSGSPSDHQMRLLPS
jgi:hypothetical protein